MAGRLLKKVVPGKYIVIHDPAGGVRKLTYKQASAQFTGVALELTPTTQFEAKDERKTLKLTTFFKGAVGIKRFLCQLLLFSGALQLFALLSPLYLQTIVDKVLMSGNGATSTSQTAGGLLLALGLGFGLVLLLKEMIGAFRGYVVSCLGSSFSFQLNNNLLRHLLKLPLSYFQTRHMGDVVSRFGSLEQIKNLLTNDLITVLVDGVMVIAALALMLTYSPTLTAVVVVAVIAFYAIRMALYKPIRHLTEEQIAASASNSSNFMETVRAIQGIKIFGRELDRQQLWQNTAVNQYNLDIRLGKWNLGVGASQGILFGLENILVIYLAAHLVMANQFTVGMLTAFLAYKLQFTGAVANLVNKWVEFKMLSLHLERIADIALAEPEVDESELTDLKLAQIKKDHKDNTGSPFKGHLTLNNIHFQYADGEPKVIDGTSIDIKSGESVAVVGPSGCGKTTLMKIAMGLLDPQEGAIHLDGYNINDIGKKNYRKQIAAVMQDDQLLSGTLADNIAFFDPDPDQEKIEQCAKQAAIHDDIQKMPMGYNSLIGDMGSSLSGGQKQRVLLARALYSEPKILFLDEATSHLDAHTELLVSNSISQLSVTRIIIAHRQETVETTDRVISLKLPIYDTAIKRRNVNKNSETS
ncbi:peptidase domain-containing ABC transporter [Porticoccus sp. W117]|uniref:peptidase domain-containing ABC transporter n=1 Tax=Porticoccus sp. W117 TaxID=3054777 RepID=UPI0025914ADA|nr:peptidase domain-containing ABC transporter [Porticoccus sp. W117]